jgi:hypothetical protein
VVCDKEAISPVIKLGGGSYCEPLVTMLSQDGCPIVYAGSLHQYMEHYQYLVGANCMLIGFGMMVFGGMMPGLAICSLTTLIYAVALILLIYQRLLPATAPEWTVWLVFYFAVGFGAGLGVGAVKWPKVGVLSLGASLGYSVGRLIDILIIQYFVD